MKGIRGFFRLIILALIIAGIIYIIPQVEWYKPSIRIKLDSDYVGTNPFDIEVKDRGKGLKRVRVSLVDAHGESELISKDYPVPVKEDILHIKLDPLKLGIKDGPAEIRVQAEDRSRIKLFSGNKVTVVQKVVVDITPPRVEVLSREHYVNLGGSGLVVYKTSSDTVRSGVKVGEYFFPGYGGYFKDPEVHMAFFAYPYNVEPSEVPVIVAEDAAGNLRTTSFFFRLKKVVYRKSTINVGDDFIKSKVASLLPADSVKNMDLKELFLKVNRELRQKNEARIREIGRSSVVKEILWHGKFHQLSNSMVQANFADERTYVYGGEVIDHQYHLGYDLAVTRKYPVEAANDGVVVFAGDLGIYGNTVIIDHGFGLSTLYGHMSSIDVNLGDRVKKKQIIGKTGETGLAVGDHLHFGVYIYGVPVLPVEWWDEQWINNNIIKKIKEAEAEFGVNERVDNKEGIFLEGEESRKQS